MTLFCLAIPNNSKKEEHEKMEKYQGLKEEVVKLWWVTGALRAVTPRLGEKFKHNPERCL